MEYYLDIWGEMCPIPIIKSQRKLKVMAIGDSLVLETEHSCTARGLVVWAQKEGYPISESEVAAGIWRLTIAKTHD
ncbi:MAG: sulfurtransferase TusA family protein [Desulfitobacteriaceae bacterium]|nr:sulfurtransferase TusA family protein [Desulfitobacteriaceae bacterium]MDI6878528.1 sulfurtransferase TusA family protein [Desulfitobacteriaceae bacterium]MDI6914658.1 sulfurtransferase TusA family protein [Desulfitobacteriaceae bacterium]